MAKADFAQIFIRANDQTKGAFDSAARNMQGLQAGAAKLTGLLRTVGLGAGLSVVGMAAFAKSSIDAADNLNDMSLRLGVSVKDLASFKLAAEQSGTSLEGVGTGIKKLTLSIGEAESGNKKTAASLKELGVTARDPKEAFFQLADAVQRIQDPATRARLLNDVLGKSYQELIPLLSEGGEALRKSAKESESFSEAMARLAPNADKFNDNLSSLKINAAAAAGTIAGPLVESLNTLFERFSTLSRLRDSGASLFEIATGGVSANVGKSIQNVNKDIASLQSRIEFSKKLGALGNPAPLEADLARLKSVRGELRQISMDSAMKIAEQQYKKTPTPRPGAIDFDKPAKPKAAARGSKADPQGAFVDRLRQEAGTLGLGAEALLRYEAAKLKLTGTNAKLANGFIAQITAFKEQQAAAKASNEEFEEFARKQEESEAAVEGAIKSLREYAAEQQFEASLLGLTNIERETAIQLRAAETAGVDTQTESFRRLAEQVKAASGDRRLASLISDTDVAKTKEFLSDVDLITNAFFDGKIGAEQMAQGIDKITGSTEKASEEVDQFAKKAAETFQSSLADFLFDPFKDGLDGMLAQFGKFIQRAIADAAAAQITKYLFEDVLKIGSSGGKSGSSVGGGSGGGGMGWISTIASLFGFAKGGVMSSHGPLALSAYASGGIASRPQLALFGEGSQNEAFVPLPDGKRIPVAMNGGGGSTINITLNGTNNAPDVRRAGGQIAREISGLLSGSQRYV